MSTELIFQISLDEASFNLSKFLFEFRLQSKKMFNCFRFVRFLVVR